MPHERRRPSLPGLLLHFVKTPPADYHPPHMVLQLNPIFPVIFGLCSDSYSKGNIWQARLLIIRVRRMWWIAVRRRHPNRVYYEIVKITHDRLNTFYMLLRWPDISHSINRKYTCRYPKSSWVFRAFSWALSPAHDAFSPLFIDVPSIFRGSWAKNTLK